jgi:hypothetical protein
MNNPDQISGSELRNNFFVLKYLNPLMRIGIRDGKNSDAGSGMDKHPGSATLVMT